MNEGAGRDSVGECSFLILVFSFPHVGCLPDFFFFHLKNCLVFVFWLTGFFFNGFMGFMGLWDYGIMGIWECEIEKLSFWFFLVFLESGEARRRGLLGLGLSFFFFFNLNFNENF